jgi:hypothetical protein
MLTDNPILKNALVASHTEPTYRQTEKDGRIEFNDERFKFVVDEGDNVLATVTNQYKLVQNREFVAALDMAADEVGVSLTPDLATYHNGRSRFEFNVPDMRFKVGNDPSDTQGRIILSNDYRGQGGLGISSGWFRLICSNGMIVGEIAHKDTRRHVGDIDVYGFVLKGLRKFEERWQAERIIAETLAAAPAADVIRADWNRGRKAAQDGLKLARREGNTPDLVDQILADTSERYHAELMMSIDRNAEEMGETFWAMAQAVSEVATHRMQMRANGEPRTHFNFTADTWATRQLGRMRELVKVRAR